jgi:hypothetical protein
MIFFPMPSAVPGFMTWGAMRDGMTFVISKDEDTGEIIASVKVAGATPFDDTRHDLGTFKIIDDAIRACREFQCQ